MINFFKFLWEKWKAFALAFGMFMSNVIFTVLYFTLILPYGLIVSLFADPLSIKTPPANTGWKPYPKTDSSLKSLESQF